MDNKLHFETTLLIDFFKEVSLSLKKKGTNYYKFSFFQEMQRNFVKFLFYFFLVFITES